MKDYKRLTKKDSCYYDDMGRIDDLGGADILYDRLAELEDKIESGELCDRKEMAREILRMIKDKGLFRYGGYLLHDSDFDTISKLYGVEAKYERL